MSFTIRMTPASARAKRQITELHKRNARGIRQAFYFLGKDLIKESSKLILEKPKHGRTYLIRRGGVRRRHVASAAGEAPANLSGALRRSLDFNVRGADRMEFGYREVFTQSKGQGIIYGKFLELGTRKIAKRPGLLLSIKANERNAVVHFETQLKKALNK